MIFTEKGKMLKKPGNIVYRYLEKDGGNVC